MNNESMLPDNLKYLRLKHGMEQLDVAYNLGRKSSSSVSDWENGKHLPKSAVLLELGEMFDVSVDDLLHKDLSQEDRNKRRKIEGLLGDYGKIDAKYYINDDSMAPTLPRGSEVTVRYFEHFEDLREGDIAVFRRDGDKDVSFRRIRMVDSLLMLIPDNGSYQPHVITGGKDIRLIGRAIKATIML